MMCLLAATALGLSACGAGDSQSGGASSPEEYPTSKLTDALSVIYGDPEEMDDTDWAKQAEEQDKKRQEIITACMAEQGFEYKPSVYDHSSITVMDEDSRTELERAEQEGYGYFSDANISGGGVEVEDPNQELLASMSDAEREAWQVALNGEPVEPGPDDEYEYDWETAGCWGKADHEMNSLDSADVDPWRVLYEDPQWSELSEGMNKVWEKTSGSPKMQALDQEWAACMADQGVSDFKTPNSIYDALSKMQEDLYGDLYASVSEDDWNDPNFTPPEPDPAKIEEARKTEIKWAVADVTCQEKTNYRRKLNDIQVKFENEFYDQNKDLIDAFLAAVSTESTEKK